jgi:hypothetical protein
MQEEDAARRLAILRGEAPPPLEEPQPDAALPAPRSRDRDAYSSATSGRKRKRHGEDDTDFEMRIARERAAAGDRAARELPTNSTTTAPLLDSKGHITLFPEPDPHSTAARSREGHPEATREAARKERELKDQYQMRLVNAAGRDGQGLTDGGPWYASTDAEAGAAPGVLVVPSKNVFGREDLGRGARAAARLDASDPLAVMRQGAKRVRELERERRKEVGERERELRALEKEERREERRRERKRKKEGVAHGHGKRGEEDGHGSRRERHASSGGDRGSGRGERRSRYDDDEFREKDKHRNEERERRSQDERDSSRKQERSSRGHEDRTRDCSREPERRREARHNDGRHRDDDKSRRPYRADDDRNRDSRRTDHS